MTEHDGFAPGARVALGLLDGSANTASCGSVAPQKEGAAGPMTAAPFTVMRSRRGGTLPRKRDLHTRS